MLTKRIMPLQFTERLNAHDHFGRTVNCSATVRLFVDSGTAHILSIKINIKRILNTQRKQSS